MDEQKNIEFWENHYLNQIEFSLTQDLKKMIDGLKSKDKIKDDWFGVFKQSASQNSDFARGAERIYYWLFNQFGIPNSSPIGADMFFETYNAFVHIDIKTAKIDNKSDYKGKIPIGGNQTSYKGVGTKYKANLPPIYSYEDKICLTYFINIIYEVDEDNVEIKAIYLICVPNGELQSIYGNDIISSGKSGFDGKGFRYKFADRSKFELLADTPYRIRRIYLADELIENEDEFIGVRFE